MLPPLGSVYLRLFHVAAIPVERYHARLVATHGVRMLLLQFGAQHLHRVQEIVPGLDRVRGPIRHTSLSVVLPWCLNQAHPPNPYFAIVALKSSIWPSFSGWSNVNSCTGSSPAHARITSAASWLNWVAISCKSFVAAPFPS
jgi:hypothetical protein